MALGNLYSFDANTETPESAKRRRALAEAIMGRQMSPQNVGEGFGAIASGIVANVQNRRAGEAERAGRASAGDVYSDLIRGITGGAGGYTPSAGAGGGAMGAANDMATGGGMDSYRNAIASIESAGSGDYAAVGPTHPELGRALGRYQVMEANIGPWSRQVLGREVSPDEFMANPELQDAIFDGIFGGYVDQYGPEGAAQAWFAGPGGVGKLNRQDSLGTSVAAYTDKFNNAFGGGQGAPTRVASLDPGAGMEVAGNRTPDVSPNTVPWSEPGAVVGNGGVTIPGVTDGPQTAAPQGNGLPPNAAPGTVAQGADGQTYMFAETTGMAGASGANGWIPYNGGSGGQQAPSPQSAPMQTAQAPQQAPQATPMPMQQRQQVAQGPSLEELLMASQNPWLDDNQRGVINMMIEQQMQRQDPAYQQGIEMNNLQLEQLRRELNAPNLMEVDGQLYNPDTGDWISPPVSASPADLVNAGDGRIYDPNLGEWIIAPNAQGAETPDVETFYDEETGLPYKGQWNPATSSWERVGGVEAPNNTIFQVDPATGEVTFQQGTGAKPLTESQSKLTLFQTLQTETQPVLLDLETQFDPSNIPDAVARSTPIAGNFFQSEQGQIYNASASAWAEGALRIATGAAATPEEMERTKRTYFAQPGDTPNTIMFKAQLREMYNRAINNSLSQPTEGSLPLPSQFAQEVSTGGSGGTPTPAQSQGDPAIMNGITEGTVIENDAGQRLVLRNGQWVEEI